MFITGPEIENHALRLINDAEKVVVLITPYFTPWEHLRFAIENARVRGVEVILVLRGGDKAKENAATAAYYVQRGVKVLYLERLHAKLYISEKTAMLTSMNLVSASASGSWEIAGLFHKSEDPTAFAELGTCFTRILDQVKLAAQREKLAPAGSAHPGARPARTASAPAARAPRATDLVVAATRRAKGSDLGVCIRCADTVARNPERPLCKECYAAWAKYENPAYEERFCHGCAKRSPTSLAKPLCRACFAAA